MSHRRGDSAGRALRLAVLVLACAHPAAAGGLGADVHRQRLACALEEAAALEATDALVSPGTQTWETIPGVVRSDGSETFRLEVEVPEAVEAVRLFDLAPCLDPRGGAAAELRDDGRGVDRVAGDLVYTSVQFRFQPTCRPSPFLGGDPVSPAGLDMLELGGVRIVELGGGTREFLARPAVGLVREDIPAPDAVMLAPDVVVTTHLVNVRSTTRETQRFLRFADGGLAGLTAPILTVLPDVFDFLVFFSTDKLEQLPSGAARNFVAGRHRSVRVTYTGTGVEPFDDGAAYGSDARLLGVNALDTYGRGLLSKIATHELLHQWVAYLAPSLGLGAADGIHFDPRSSVGSLTGGFRWLEDPELGLVLDCAEGNSGAHRAAPLDLYMMGLLDGAAVPPLHAYDPASPSPVLRCGAVVDDVVRTVTIEDIEAVHGVRTPGPATAQRDFSIAFVAETHDRLLTPTELAFYDTIAAHYTAPVAPGADDPYHGSAEWAPLTRFFGAGVSWRSDVLVCGNGRREGPEQCDDGNVSGGDGCSAACFRELAGFPVPVEVLGVSRVVPRGRRRFRVTLLGSARFDAATLDMVSVRLGRLGGTPIAMRLRDVDRDGRMDADLRFVSREVGIGCGDRLALLSAHTQTGMLLEAQVPLRVLGCPRTDRPPGPRP